MHARVPPLLAVLLLLATPSPALAEGSAVAREGDAWILRGAHLEIRVPTGPDGMAGSEARILARDGQELRVRLLRLYEAAGGTTFDAALPHLDLGGSTWRPLVEGGVSSVGLSLARAAEGPLVRVAWRLDPLAARAQYEVSVEDWPWAHGDRLVLELEVPPRLDGARWWTNDSARADRGRAAADVVAAAPGRALVVLHETAGSPRVQHDGAFVFEAAEESVARRLEVPIPWAVAAVALLLAAAPRRRRRA